MKLGAMAVMLTAVVVIGAGPMYGANAVAVKDTFTMALPD